MLGTSLGGYRLIEPIGEGGTGTVYIGQHEVLGRRAAVKVLHRNLSSDVDIVRRFFNEAQAAAAVRNPGITQVFDFGTAPDGSAYLVMELLEGETLAVRLARRRRPDAVTSCRLGRQVANVLQAAHAAGITHRDLKPDNLFLVADPEVIGGERVKVLDFGIAKLTGDANALGLKTETGVVMGTPNYMSPEQCRHTSRADARSDIYSLGCILFEIACGRPPFARPGLADTIAGHLYEEPPHPQQIAPETPIQLAALVLNMLAKSPDSRPQTMADVVRDLDDIVGMLGRPAAAPRARAASVAGSGGHAARAASVGGSAGHAARAASGSGEPAVAAGAQAQAPAAGAQAGRSRMPWVLGALVIAGAAGAIALVISRDHPARPGHLVSYDKIGPQAGDPAPVATLPAVTTPPVAPSPPIDAAPLQPAPDAPSAPAPQSGAATDALPAKALTVECQADAQAKRWDALAQCAARLQPLDAKTADDLAARAKQEALSAPHAAAVTAELQANNLKFAKVDLDQVWPQSVDYSAVKAAYDDAESHAIDQLVAQLERAKTDTCGDYNQAVAKARATLPARVTSEATRRTTCVTKCDANALANQGFARYHAGELDTALALYERAYACEPSPTMAQRTFIVACNARNAPKARSSWHRLPAALRTHPTVDACIRNGITEDALNAP